MPYPCLTITSDDSVVYLDEASYPKSFLDFASKMQGGREIRSCRRDHSIHPLVVFANRAKFSVHRKNGYYFRLSSKYLDWYGTQTNPNEPPELFHHKSSNWAHHFADDRIYLGAIPSASKEPE